MSGHLQEAIRRGMVDACIYPHISWVDSISLCVDETVASWLRDRRDEIAEGTTTWLVLDDLLDRWTGKS